MYCYNCGKKLEEGMKHCPYCGTKIKISPVKEPESSDEGYHDTKKRDTVRYDAGNFGAEKKPDVLTRSTKKSGNGKRMILLLAAAVVIGLIFLMKNVLFGGYVLKPADYVLLEVKGLNTEGQAVLSFDTSALLADIEKKKNLTEREREEIRLITLDADKDFALSKSSALSNGDEIQIKSNLDKSLLKDYGVTLKNGTRKVKVENLLDVQEIALTGYASFEFSGFEGGGYGYVSIDRDALWEAAAEQIRTLDDSQAAEDFIENDLGYYLNSVTVSPSYMEDLSNGDVMEATVSSETTDITQYGLRLVGGSIEETVEGLEAPQEVDLAEALTINFAGTCPNVYVEREVNYDFPYVYLTSLPDLGYDENIVASNGDVYEGEITYDETEMLRAGFVVTNNKYSYTISGLNTHQLTVESLDDEVLQPLAENMEALARRQLPECDGQILDRFNDGKGWIVWDQSKIVLERGKFAYLAAASYTQNRVYLIYHGALPLKRWDRSVMQSDVYFVVNIYDVKESPEGELSYEYWDYQLCMDESEIDEYINDGIEEMGGDAKITELTGAASGQKLQLELEGEAEVSGQEELEAQPQAGEIAGNAAGQAASVIICEGHVYARYDMNLTWELARQFCEAAGGHLATVTSEKENAVIKRLLKGAPYGSYWLGATDREWEGGWRWITGEAFEWKNWDYSQPDNYTYYDENGENYLETGSSFSYCWNDQYGDYAEGGFILEVEPVGVREVHGEWSAAGIEQETDAEGADDEAARGEAADVGEANTEDAKAEAASAGIMRRPGTAEEAASDEADSGSDTEKQKKAAVSEMADMIPVSSYRSGTEEYVQDPYGNDHFYSLYLDASENAAVNYDLKGEWSKLTGTLSTWSEAGSEASFEIAIWGDGELLFSRYDYKKTDAPVPFSIDVTGVKRLSIRTANRGEYSEGYLFINEGKLISGGTETTQPITTSMLSELPVIQMGAYEKDNGQGLPTDSYGTIHSEWNTFPVSDDSTLWNLAGEYRSLDGVLVTTPGACDSETSVSVEILADGESLFKAENFDIYQGYLPLSLDLTGKNILEIHTWQTGESGRGSVSLADTVLQRATERPERAEAITPVFPEMPEVVEQQAAEILTNGNYRYYRFDEPLTWKQAAAFCQAAGATLACPATAEKNAAVKLLVSDGIEGSYWLGGRMESSRWIWNDGTAFGDYQNWSGGQPDNYEGREYLLCTDRNGTWNDADDLAVNGFVMEVAAISKQSGENAVKITDLEWEGSQYTDVMEMYNVMDDCRTVHFDSVEMNGSYNAWFSVILNGAYSEFKGNVVSCLEASGSVSLQLAVFGDGKLLYELRDFTKDEGMTGFSVDVTGVQSLTVATSNSGSYDNGYLYLADTELTAAEQPEAGKAVRLSRLVAVDEVRSEGEAGLFTDAYGAVHDRYLSLQTVDGAKVLYNLEGSYTTFAGTITVDSQNTAPDGEVKIVISTDGETAFEVEGFDKREGPVSFEVDLTGKQLLEIRAETANDQSSGRIYLTDDVLLKN